MTWFLKPLGMLIDNMSVTIISKEVTGRGQLIQYEYTYDLIIPYHQCQVQKSETDHIITLHSDKEYLTRVYHLTIFYLILSAKQLFSILLFLGDIIPLVLVWYISSDHTR